MQDSATLLSAIDRNTQALIAGIRQFNSEQFTQRPFAESWSAAEVTEHIYLLDKVIAAIVQGAGETTERKGDEVVQVIEDKIGNRENKFTPPSTIVPQGKFQDADELINNINTVREEIKAFLPATDLMQICTSFTHRFGPMTRWEWIRFLITHTERHTEQLQDISTILHSKK